MKPFALFLALVFASPVVMAQEDSTEIPSKAKIDRKDFKPYKIRENKRTTGSLEFHIGLNQMVNENMEISGGNAEAEYWPSLGTTVGIMFSTRIGGVKSPVHIKYGPSLNWHSFRLTGDNVLMKNPDPEVETEGIGEFGSIDGLENIERSSFTNVYWDLPVMLNFEFWKNTSHTVSVGFGGYGGIRSRTKRHLSYNDFEGDLIRERTINDFNMNPFRYGLIAQIGFNKSLITYRLDYNQMFDDNNLINYQISTLTIGFML